MGRVLAPMLVMGLTALTACTSDDDTTSTGPDTEYEGTATLWEADDGAVLCYWNPCQEGEALPVVGLDWADVDWAKDASGVRSGSAHVVGTYGPEGLTLTQPPGPPQDGEDTDDTDFTPACDEPDVVDESQGGDEWEAMSQDYGPFDPPDLVAAWVSHPSGDGEGRFVGNLVVLPGSGDDALALVREHYDGPVCVVEREAPTAEELQQIQEELSDAAATAALRPIGASADERRGVVVAEVWVADAAALEYAADRWGDLVELSPLLRPVP